MVLKYPATDSGPVSCTDTNGERFMKDLSVARIWNASETTWFKERHFQMLMQPDEPLMLTKMDVGNKKDPEGLVWV